MSAAVEAGIEGIPAIGFSLLDYDWEANFEATKKYVKQITKTVMENGLPEGVVLNVNIPKLREKDMVKPVEECKSDSKHSDIKCQHCSKN